MKKGLSLKEGQVSYCSYSLSKTSFNEIASAPYKSFRPSESQFATSAVLEDTLLSSPEIYTPSSIPLSSTSFRSFPASSTSASVYAPRFCPSVFSSTSASVYAPRFHPQTPSTASTSSIPSTSSTSSISSTASTSS